jgi:hypothetical protein
MRASPPEESDDAPLPPVATCTPADADEAEAAGAAETGVADAEEGAPAAELGAMRCWARKAAGMLGRWPTFWHTRGGRGRPIIIMGLMFSVPRNVATLPFFTTADARLEVGALEEVAEEVGAELAALESTWPSCLKRKYSLLM